MPVEGSVFSDSEEKSLYDETRAELKSYQTQTPLCDLLSELRLTKHLPNFIAIKLFPKLGQQIPLLKDLETLFRPSTKLDKTIRTIMATRGPLHDLIVDQFGYWIVKITNRSLNLDCILCDLIFQQVKDKDARKTKWKAFKTTLYGSLGALVDLLEKGTGLGKDNSQQGQTEMKHLYPLVMQLHVLLDHLRTVATGLKEMLRNNKAMSSSCGTTSLVAALGQTRVTWDKFMRRIRVIIYEKVLMPLDLILSPFGVALVSFGLPHQSRHTMNRDQARAHFGSDIERYGQDFEGNWDWFAPRRTNLWVLQSLGLLNTWDFNNDKREDNRRDFYEALDKHRIDKATRNILDKVQLAYTTKTAALLDATAEDEAAKKDESFPPELRASSSVPTLLAYMSDLKRIHSVGVYALEKQQGAKPGMTRIANEATQDKLSERLKRMQTLMSKILASEFEDLDAQFFDAAEAVAAASRRRLRLRLPEYYFKRN